MLFIFHQMKKYTNIYRYLDISIVARYLDMYDEQGLRHGPATYFHPNGNKEEATYVEGYEEGESTVYYARWGT